MPLDDHVYLRKHPATAAESVTDSVVSYEWNKCNPSAIVIPFKEVPLNPLPKKLLAVTVGRNIMKPNKPRKTSFCVA